jgi:6,7-dimethyl-8-ribityllumazine synthase
MADGSPHLLVVEARFYNEIADELLRGARAAIGAAGATCDVVTVPGALEIPAAIAMALKGNKAYDGFVALGCVIRGETTHYETVANESARGLMDIAVAFAVPLGNGIPNVENDDQAWARARVGEANKGGAAANAALRMIDVHKQLTR